MDKEKFLQKQKIINRLLYFSIPFAIMLVIFIFLRVTPFGNSSVLTWDLSEQYVDFFAFYRDTLLHHPSQFFYSFTNGVGGETIGLWAYYLLSPFNLILLFFKRSFLPIGIVLILLIKYGCAGFSFGYCLEKLGWTDQKWITASTVCYALMGWVLANQFNIMWIDVLILLPFILYGIEKMFNENSSIYYTIFLALTLFINFYMGYMVSLFLILYFIWTAIRKWTDWKNFGKVFIRFSISSLLSVGAVAFVLLPTYFNLQQSKGTYTQHGLTINFEYAPWKMLSKFIIGSVNEGQLIWGPPNLFVGSFIIFGFIFYFLAKNIPWKEKIAAGLVSVILFFSMFWSPLDLIWHAFQPPVDYTYRFSFLVITWMILLALRGLKEIGKLRIYQLIISFVIPIVCWGVVYVTRSQYDYITVPNLIYTLLFMILMFIVMTLMLLGTGQTKKKFFKIILKVSLFMLVIIECGVNADKTLRNITYNSESTYVNFVNNLEPNIKWINNNDSSFFRVGQTFSRSENDALNLGYRGMSGFTSTQNAAVTNFMKLMGQQYYLGKENYTQGTMLVDSIMDVKYFVTPVNQLDNINDGNAVMPATSYRPDVAFYKRVHTLNGVNIYKNPFALSIGFATNPGVLTKNILTASDDIATNQGYFLNRIAGTNFDFFNSTNASVKMINCRVDDNGMLKTIDTKQPSVYKLVLKHTSSDPYYMQVTPDLRDAGVAVNGTNIISPQSGDQPMLYTVCANAYNKTVTIDITPNNGQPLNLNGFQIYQFDLSNFKKAVHSISKYQLKLTYNGRMHLKGYIDIPEGRNVMMTTIPYNKGWKVTVDGHQVKTKKAFDTFLAVSLPTGQHKIELSFWPSFLNLGIIITIITWIILILCFKYERKTKK